MTEPAGKEFEQYEIGSIMDLTPFDELERRINALLDRHRQLNDENSKLKDELLQRDAEIEKLAAKCDELQHNSIDKGREDLIRNKIKALLDKLEGY